MAYSDEYKGNIYENWIVRLYYDAEGTNDWTGVSTDTYSSYHPIITNQPSIRRSIDLANSKAKTGNISLKLINFNHQGSPFSETLLGGSKKYINRKVEVYSRLVDSSQIIYTGRLVDISHDLESISLSITDKRPSDFVSIPNEKEDISDTWIPVAYGNFIKTTSSDLYTGKALYPAPEVTQSADFKKYFIVGGANTNVNPHYYDKTCNKFFPILASAGGSEISNSPIVQNGRNYVTIDKYCYKDIIIKPSIGSDIVSGWDSTFPTPADLPNIFDNPTSVGADSTSFDFEYDFQAPFTTFPSSNTSKGKIKIATPHSHKASSTVSIGVTLTHWLKIVESGNYSTNNSFNLLYGDVDDDSSNIAEICDTNPNSLSPTMRVGSLTASKWNAITQHCLQFSLAPNINISGSSNFQWRGSIFDIYFSLTTSIEQGDDTAIETALKEIKEVYIGGNGLDESWNVGNMASKPHTVHRDLLYRFTGYTSEPENWGDSLTGIMSGSEGRGNWGVRWWATKPEELDKILERIQKEGCFIFLWNPSGAGKYVWVKDSYSSSDVDATLDDNDISSVQISNTPFSQLLTKMDVEYSKHPAEGKYNKKETFQNSTARTNWNIGAKENIKKESLKMLIDTTTGLDEDIQGYWDYYNNIFGDVKIIVKCNIVNPAKMNLDVGDIVQFDLDTKPFGYSWSQYYMITSLTRKIGEMNIECREVG